LFTYTGHYNNNKEKEKKTEFITAFTDCTLCIPKLVVRVSNKSSVFNETAVKAFQ